MGISAYPGYISSCVTNASTPSDLSTVCEGKVVSQGIATIAAQVLIRAMDTRFQFEFVQIPQAAEGNTGNDSMWHNSVNGLQKGYYDMTMDLWTITEDRAKDVQFSIPVLFGKRVFLMNKRNIDIRSHIRYGGLEWLTVSTMAIGVLVLLISSFAGWLCDRWAGYRLIYPTVMDTLWRGDTLIYNRNSRQTVALTVLIALLCAICSCFFSATAKSNLQPRRVAPIRSLTQLARGLSSGRYRLLDFEKNYSPLESMLR